MLEMEVKRQEIEQKREAAYQKELREKRLLEKREKEKDRATTSGTKRPKEKLKRRGDEKKSADVPPKPRERTEEEKRLAKVPSIKKKGGLATVKSSLPIVRGEDERREDRKKRKPLASIMAKTRGDKPGVTAQESGTRE